mmetsp:Transcript_13454/g.38697  ORF Transcript_13454/g.38697 Transcript_13454/m.38697 type:complete len:331 (+) Transcript_13454:655-1647(+)
MDKIYPAWNETQAFIHEAFESERRAAGAAAGAGVSFDESRSVLSRITERYGLWQDRECRDMKAMLLPWEDHGSGRVHLTDFYRASLSGRWQFSESTEYLRRLGALDETVPSSPRVIIVNYLLSYSNCVGSTAYNDLCCVSECEALMAAVERHVASSSATPDGLLEVVADLPSSTVPAGRQLGPLLEQRLRWIAAQHDGAVPIYGRLFAQWMHHAYPRECPYPHAVGTTQQLSPLDYARTTGANRTASEAEMQGVVARPERRDHPQETVPWDPREEVLAPPTRTPVGFAALHFAVTAVAMCLLLASLGGVTARRRRTNKAGQVPSSPQIPV